MPRSSMSSYDDWIEYLKTFPLRFKQVTISGGEPTFVDYMPNLVNWLLMHGYHVLVYSNLYRPTLFLQIIKSWRFKILATFHEGDSILNFLSSYQSIFGIHEIEVIELNTNYIPWSTKFREITSPDDPIMKCNNKSNGLLVSPDRQLYRSCYEHCIGKSKKREMQ